MNTFELKTTENSTVKLFYAGLLGVAQGVLEVCKKINLEHLNIEFHIFGEGAEKVQIENYIKNNPSKKIVFHGMLERNDLISKLTTFDVALVPLKSRIYGSVPSKIFEYSALGIPILYFGGGEGEQIIKVNRLGWIAEVQNHIALNAVLEEISEMKRSNIQLMKNEIFEHYKSHFNLSHQIKNLIEKKVF